MVKMGDTYFPAGTSSVFAKSSFMSMYYFSNEKIYRKKRKGKEGEGREGERRGGEGKGGKGGRP